MTVEEKKRAYEKILRIGDYTLINRHTKFEPWIVCWKFDDESYTWNQGHYFQGAIFAILFMIGREYPEKLIEAAESIKEN